MFGKANARVGRWWSWLPLVAAVLATYGPIGNNYGFALYFLTWKHGFVKRGLVGELFAAVPFLGRWTLLGIELAFLAAAYALTYFVFRRLIFADDERSLLAAVLLASPAGLPHLGYLFAQPDVTLYLLVLLCLVCWRALSPEWAVWIVSALCCVAMLAHEAFLVMFYPLMVAIMWRKCRVKELRWGSAAGATTIVLIAWIAIVHFGTLKVSAGAILAEALSRTDVPVQRQVYDVMASTLQQQRDLVRRMYSPPVVRTLCWTLVLCLPYFLLLRGIAMAVLEAQKTSRLDRWLFCLLMFTPLVLCAFGHDTTRWIGAACLDVSLYVLYVLSAGEDGAIQTRMREWVRQRDVFAMIVYLALIGPMGATGVRAAEQLDVLWR